jgi:putative hydrolase of the HAD superfamily
MAVVSNTSFGEPVIRYELAKYGLTDHLAFVLVSSDYAVRKPNVLLFETAAARLHVPAEDIWFVGDRLDTDVAGARAAGMTAVWFNPSSRSDQSSDADLTVTSWADLVGRVSAQSGAVNGASGQSY